MLMSPLTDVQVIGSRLDSVQYFLEQKNLREDIREILKECPDMERALSRLAMGYPAATRDLLAIKDALRIFVAIKEMLYSSSRGLTAGSRETVAILMSRDPAVKPRDDVLTLDSHEPLMNALACALRSDVPLLARDGNFVAEGYSAPLDEFRRLRDEGRQMIAALESQYQKLTGIGMLKIRFNQVLGYYVEITPTHQAKITSDFIHRQTMANAMRYTTVELSELERKISEAADRTLKLELEIFEALVKQATDAAFGLRMVAHAIAGIDVFTALAQRAEAKQYCRPTMDDSFAFEIKGGRHPVVEERLQKLAEAAFIANDSDLHETQRLWLLTGPNMAGKSTFLRQNALIAIMAQMGSFVPATSAHIGVVDRLFSRVGAADDLARGQSTFMVEMVETATILHQASARSLVILDEIGRGTATFDGLSIAWAVIEYLHDVTRCRALFATHYHELTHLGDRLSHLACYTMKVKEWKDSIIFLHQVEQGVADRSYGIHVAQLAGLPSGVIIRAKEVLDVLEKDKDERVIQPLTGDLPLFTAVREKATPAYQPLLDELKSMDPDTLSPRDALDFLYKIRRQLT